VDLEDVSVRRTFKVLTH